MVATTCDANPYVGRAQNGLRYHAKDLSISFAGSLTGEGRSALFTHQQASACPDCIGMFFSLHEKAQCLSTACNCRLIDLYYCVQMYTTYGAAYGSPRRP